jgi:hypothetical protein
MEYRRSTDGNASLITGAVPAGARSIDLENPSGSFEADVDSGTGIFVLVAAPDLEADEIKFVVGDVSVSCRVVGWELRDLTYIC